jgi:hypothetical protein
MIVLKMKIDDSIEVDGDNVDGVEDSIEDSVDDEG